MRVAIASGKGGTGKTTVAVNLALTAARAGHRVHLCDCDVEEPNAHLFLEPESGARREVALPVPVVDQAACLHCGLCAEICRFNAIAALPDQTMVFPELCHGCAGCWLVCPAGALSQGERVLGEVAVGEAHGLILSQGILRVGETVVPPLIAAVKAEAGDAPWVILDAPPGATCPVVETLHGVDYVVLVAEPTPFGRHDLDLVVQLARALDVPCGVVVNRDVPGRDLIDAYTADEGLEILARIPFARSLAAACAAGGLAVDVHEGAAAAMSGLLDALATREVMS